jgi:hypothetical protein
VIPGLCACDLGKRSKPASEPLTIVASEPEAGEGLDCELDSGASCGLPVAGPLRFKLDRWLLPTTAVRQSVSLYTAGTGLGVTLRPYYDVASRNIEYALDAPLPGGVVFTLRINDANDDPNGFGFRAFDGPSLATSRTISLRTSLEPPVTVVAAPVPPSCADIVAVFSRAGCSSASCHSRQSSPQCASATSPMAWDESSGSCVSVPRMGLLLDDIEGLRSTAVNRVAHETQNGPDVSRRYESRERFGDQMPIIDRSRPENSYLIYKLLINRDFNRELGERFVSDDPFAPMPLTDAQISQARDFFVRFGPMPPENVDVPNGVSLYDAYLALVSWIRAGAACP